MAIHLNSDHDIASGISNAGGNRIIWRCPWSKSSVLQASFVFHQKASGMGWCGLCQQRSVWRGRCEYGDPTKLEEAKFIPWSKFHVPDQDEVPTLKCSGASESIKVNFISIKQRRAEVAKTSQKHQGSSDEGTDDSSGESRDSTTKIFFSDFMSSVCYFEEIPASRENICPKKTLRHFEDHSFGNLHTQFGGILNDGTW